MLKLTRGSNLTIEKAIQSPSLIEIEVCIGQTACTELIIGLLNELNSLIKSNLDRNDLTLYAYQVQNSFRNLKFDELIYSIKNGIEGRYGKIYGQFNYIVLNEWLEKSYQEFISFRDNKHLDQKQLLTFGSSDRTIDEKPKAINEFFIQEEINKFKK